MARRPNLFESTRSTPALRAVARQDRFTDSRGRARQDRASSLRSPQCITHVLWDTSTSTLRRCPASGRHNRNAYNFAKRRNQTGSGELFLLQRTPLATDASMIADDLFELSAHFHQLFSKLGNFTRGDNRRSRLPQLRAQVGFFIDLNRQPVNGLRFLPNSVRPYRGQPRFGATGRS